MADIRGKIDGLPDKRAGRGRRNPASPLATDLHSNYWAQYNFVKSDKKVYVISIERLKR
jgi:hypothetical protein